MPTKKSTPKKEESKTLPEAVASLTEAVMFTSDIAHPWKRMGIALGRGIMYGVGIALVFAVLIPLAVWFLGRFDWVPLIGDFFVDISERIENAERFR